MKNLIFLILAILCSQAFAAGKCSKKELEAIDHRLGKDNDIVSLHKTFKQIEECDAMDGGIADGFNDVANRLLAKDLRGVSSSPFLKDKNFQYAILKSVSDGTEVKTFEKINRNAKACAATIVFCKTVQNVCEEAERSAAKIREENR